MPLDIRLEKVVRVPPRMVWEALTSPDELVQWWRKGVVLEAVPGGHFIEPWQDESGKEFLTQGDVLSVDPPEHLRMSWWDTGWPVLTTVTIVLKPTDEGGTRILLNHEGWEQFPEEERRELRRAHDTGWRFHLDNLARHLESKLP